MKNSLKILMCSLVIGTLTSCNYIFSSSSNSSSSLTNISSSLKGSENTNSSLGNPEDEVTLNILEINDMHGHAYSKNDKDLANLSYYINQVRNRESYDNVLLIANGDMFQGTAFSNLSHGESVIKTMNEMSFDMMGIGNHEFDWGLDEVLKYWDGVNTSENYEANFPLINGNVRDSNNSNKLIGEDNENDNILPYTIVEKSGIKVGLLSYIGDQTSSICQNKFGSYYIDCYGDNDTSFISKVKNDAMEVKNKGADLVVLNIHEGNSDSPLDLYYNNAFAGMKDSEGNYLIDAVINGHTHSTQKATIKRNGGASLPIVQGGSNCNGIGQIDLNYNIKTKKVTSVNVSNVKNSTSGIDTKVKETEKSEYVKIEPIISEVLGVSSSYVNRESLGLWAVDIMKRYSGADVSLINTGGIRSTGNITKGSQITIENLYEINPFDNSLVYVKVIGKELKKFARNNSNYYYFNSDFTNNSIEENKEYNLLTIDYVYYSTYFNNAFTNYKEIKVSSLCARDLMIKELKAHDSNDKNIDFDHPVYKIEENVFPEI